MSNVSGDEGSFSSGNTGEEVHKENKKQQQHQNHPHGSNFGACNSNISTNRQQKQQATKKQRNLPGTPDPNAEVIALSPTTLMATNRFVCEICNKGFQRDQNLQLHRRCHNLPWKLRQRGSSEVKKRVYVCPEPSCVHHNPTRALGDLTGIKKHYSRKHGEKKWKCDKCSKRYAVQSDWKAHHKTCGTREYKCDCGTIFCRRDSFITHRAFCDALTEENNQVNQSGTMTPNMQNDLMATMPPSRSSNTLFSQQEQLMPTPFKSWSIGSTTSATLFGGPNNILQLSSNNSPAFNYLQDSKNGSASPHMSATALLQKAAQMGATSSTNSINSPRMHKTFVSSSMPAPDQIFNKEISLMFDSNYSTMNDSMGMLIGPTMFLGSDHNPGLLKNVQHRKDLVVEGDTMGHSRIGGSDMTTVHDFLGVGGSTSTATSLHEPHQRLHIMNHFHHHLPHGDSAIEKSIWDI